MLVFRVAALIALERSGRLVSAAAIEPSHPELLGLEALGGRGIKEAREVGMGKQPTDAQRQREESEAALGLVR